MILSTGVKPGLEQLIHGHGLAPWWDTRADSHRAVLIYPYKKSSANHVRGQWQARPISCHDLRVKEFFTTGTNPQRYSDGRWSRRLQPTETGSDVLTPLWRSCDFKHDTQTSAIKSLNSSVGVFYVWPSLGKIFVGFLFVCFINFCVCHVSEVSSTPPPPQWIQQGNSCLCLKAAIVLKDESQWGRSR